MHMLMDIFLILFLTLYTLATILATMYFLFRLEDYTKFRFEVIDFLLFILFPFSVLLAFITFVIMLSGFAIYEYGYKKFEDILHKEIDLKEVFNKIKDKFNTWR